MSPCRPYMRSLASIVNVGESRAHSRFAVPKELICTSQLSPTPTASPGAEHPPAGWGRPVSFRHMRHRLARTCPKGGHFAGPDGTSTERVRGQVAALVGPQTVQIKDFEVPDPGPGATVLEVT